MTILKQQDRAARQPWLTRLTLTLTLLASTLSLPALAADVPTTSSNAPTVLRVAAVAHDNSGRADFVGLPQRVADDPILKQALSRRGITLKWVPITPAAVAALVNESFANKQIDFAYYGDLPSVILNANGIATRLVAPSNIGSNTYLLVSKDSTAKSLRELKGKRIALHRGRPWEASFARLAASEGLSLKDFRIVNLNPQAGAAALAAGNVDALFTLDEAWLLQDKQLGRIIWSSQTAPVEYRMRADLWGSADYVAKYPDITQELVNATIRANYWISQEKNRDAYFVEQAKFGLPESVIRRDNVGNSVSWKEYWSPLYTPAITTHYQQVIDYALQSGLIRTPLTAQNLLAPQFLPVALKAAGISSTYWKP